MQVLKNGRTNIYEVYKTWQRGSEAFLADMPHNQLVDYYFGCRTEPCRVLELLQDYAFYFVHMYIHVNTPLSNKCSYVCMHTHLYKKETRLPLIHWYIKYCRVMSKGRRLKTRAIFWYVSWSQLHDMCQHYQNHNCRCEHRNDSTHCPPDVPPDIHTHVA